MRHINSLFNPIMIFSESISMISILDILPSNTSYQVGKAALLSVLNVDKKELEDRLNKNPKAFDTCMDSNYLSFLPPLWNKYDIKIFSCTML